MRSLLPATCLLSVWLRHAEAFYLPTPALQPPTFLSLQSTSETDPFDTDYKSSLSPLDSLACAAAEKYRPSLEKKKLRTFSRFLEVQCWKSPELR